jgi:hypothetical protein
LYFQGIPSESVGPEDQESALELDLSWLKYAEAIMREAGIRFGDDRLRHRTRREVEEAGLRPIKPTALDSIYPCSLLVLRSELEYAKLKKQHGAAPE